MIAKRDKQLDWLEQRLGDFERDRRERIKFYVTVVDDDTLAWIERITSEELRLRRERRTLKGPSDS